MTDFLDDERRRLAYADRSPTLERQDRQLLSDGHLGECVLTIDDGWRCAVGCRDAQLAAAERSAERQLADGTGRHSRKEMEAGLEWLAAYLTSCDFVGDSGCTDPTCQKCHGPTPPTQTIAGVQSRGFRAHDSSRHCRDRSCDYEVGGRWSCEYPPICTPPLADGTGRHSRKEIEQATSDQQIRLKLKSAHRTLAEHHDLSCPLSISMAISDIDWCIKQLMPRPSEPPTQTIAGVQFSSVPALCAAFEQLLSASAAYLWTWRPDREHCSGPQMEAYRELRRLVAGAGKDVP